jgi:molybdate transport system regulatory protein
MALLQSIDSTQSIAAAARAVGLSYKAAWDAVDAMNNLSGKPLVQRTKGGKGGGGTKLTARGRQLVATFRAVETENTRFLEVLNTRINTLDRDLRVMERLTLLTSARNHFSGKVVRIKKGAVNDEIELALSGGERLVSVVTHESVESLGLKVGCEAVALVKASSVVIAIEGRSKLKISARNQLRGVIQRLTHGAVNAEVVIELKGGIRVAAIVTLGSVKALELTEGKPACAVFDASSVILGVIG